MDDELLEGALPQKLADIPGWYFPADQDMFAYFLGVDDEIGAGDLVELGAYLGKSAAHMGSFLRPGERLTVCDLFASDYRGLDRGAFERNYRALRGDLPIIVQGPSDSILGHVEPGTARFVHVDASHEYDHVVIDIDSAGTMLTPTGIVAFDDFRNAHNPGVSAAVWAAVAGGRLTPVCVTNQKFYGVFGDGAGHLKRLLSWLEGADELRYEVKSVAGGDVARVWRRKPTRSQKPRQDRQTPGFAELEGRLRRIDRRTKRIENRVAALSPGMLERGLRKVRSRISPH